MKMRMLDQLLEICKMWPVVWRLCLCRIKTMMKEGKVKREKGMEEEEEEEEEEEKEEEEEEKEEEEDQRRNDEDEE